MSEEEAYKLRINNQMLESNNKILAKKIKDIRKERDTINKLYKTEKAKIDKIHRIVTLEQVNEKNYNKFINWLKDYLK